MALNNYDQGRVREYLLGKLSEAEQEEIEKRLMLEDELSDPFEASKSELVEEYCAGELGNAERRFFEEHFLRSVEGQQLYKFVLAMNSLSDPQPAPVDCNEEPVPVFTFHPPPRPGIFAQSWTLIATQPWAVAIATSMVLVVAAVIIVRQLMPRPAGQTFATTLQSYNLNRAEGEYPTRIKLPPNTAFLKLRLQLPKPAAAGTRYTAELDDRINKKKIDVVESDAESVTVVIPADLTPRRQYAINLSIINTDGSELPRSYRFIIE